MGRLQSVYAFGVRTETAHINIHSQRCKAGKIPKRVWNSPAQLVIVKDPANTMRGMIRCGCGMSSLNGKEKELGVMVKVRII